MNKLELLIEERTDLQESLACVSEGLKRLNLLRDADFHSSLETTVEQFKNRIQYLDEQIEKTKQSIGGLTETSSKKGHILTAKNNEGKDMFLRLRFFREGLRGDDWTDAILLEWVDQFNDECFMQFEEYQVGNKIFSEEKFKEVFKHYQKNKKISANIQKNTMNFKQTEKETTQSYIFLEDMN